MDTESLGFVREKAPTQPHVAATCHRCGQKMVNVWSEAAWQAGTSAEQCPACKSLVCGACLRAIAEQGFGRPGVQLGLYQNRDDLPVLIADGSRVIDVWQCGWYDHLQLLRSVFGVQGLGEPATIYQIALALIDIEIRLTQQAEAQATESLGMALESLRALLKDPGDPVAIGFAQAVLAAEDE